MGETGDETKGFKVNDRRAFTPEGELRETETAPVLEKPEPERVTPSQAEEGDSPEITDSGGRPREAPGAEIGSPPEVGFMDLVNMLLSNALMQLGDMPDPVSGKTVEDLPAAQVMIALLTMLQQKTKGNLDKDEAKVLDDVLYDLRMRFMTKTNVIKR